MYKDWYKNEPEPKFCTKCRKALVTTELSAGFDAYSGEERYQKYLACPDAVKHLLYMSGHDVWEIKNEEVPYFSQEYVTGGY